MKQARTRAKGAITRISNWVKNNQNNVTNAAQFEDRVISLKESLQKYTDAQDEIESYLIQFSTDDSEIRETIEDQVYDTLFLIRECIQKLTPAAPPISQASSIQPSNAPKIEVKLPQVNINPFKGDTAEWTSFFQLFYALILDNSHLSKIQKFIYLKSFLRNEPLKLIESLAVTNENFDVAIEILRNRYENKISVINAHFVSLLEVSPLTKCNAQTLREFVTNCSKNLLALKNLHYSYEQLFEFLIIYLLGKKIDFGTRKAFETERDLTELPDLKEFFEFLGKRCLVLENLSSTEVPSAQNSQQKVFKTPNTKASFHLQTHPNNSQMHCLFCNDNSHKIYTCTKFKNLQDFERKKFVVFKQLCFNCLGSKHTLSNCPAPKTCFICSQKHHTLLHNAFKPQNSQGQTHNPPYRPLNSQHNPPHINPPFSRPVHSQVQQTHQQTLNSQAQGSRPHAGQPQNRENENSGASQSFHTVSALSTKNTQVLLATACVTLYDGNRRPLQAKALLDNGSQHSFVTEGLVKRLKLTPYVKTTHVSGIALSNNVTNKMIDLKIHSNVYPHRKFDISCAILPAITGPLPSTLVDVSSWSIPRDIALADPSFSRPSEVDLLIGSELYYTLLTQGMIRLGHGLPTALNTHLGWILGGTFPQNSRQQNGFSHLVTGSSARNVQPSVSLFVQSPDNNSLESMVTKFWSMEEIHTKAPLSLDDEKAEACFKNSAQILEDGTYQVDLPLKSPSENLRLGDSLAIATKRFHNLEKRFVKDPEYFQEYQKFIHEYIDLGHAKVIPLTPVNKRSEPKYFLPHHAVVKDGACSTKLRVVFDASCKSTTGLSLNDVTLKGFQVQPDLYDILLRFRSFKYVLTSDIEKMFRQIKINPNQTFLLNILWRDASEDLLQCVELKTVTYGTNSAPFLATRVLNDVALKNNAEYPLASQSLLTQCYMDDILSGCDDPKNLDVLYSELISLLNTSGFQLHKWCSNSKKFLDKISLTEKVKEVDMNFDETPNKVLGLKWNPILDFFSVSIPEVKLSGPITKRKILSVIAQCYDPLGFLSIVIVTGKIIVQKLWTLKLDWDTPITDNTLLQEWTSFIDDLPLLKTLKIPRYLFSSEKTVLSIEFHGFSDASLKAYAACVYARTSYTDGTVSCHLITSKSRVSPLKTVTLPRLELCAMVLLSKLVSKLTLIFETRLSLDSVNLWTDSQIALCWINSHASRWNVFVANRVAQIQELTSNFKWRHINSSDNPADYPSRGLPIPQVQNCDSWWQGPEFLHDPNLSLSKFDNTPTLSDLPEEKKISLIGIVMTNQEAFWSQLFHRFSNFFKLKRTVAYILRFIHNSKNNQNKLTGPLTVQELKAALNLITKMLQSIHFSKEILELQQDKILGNKSLIKLKPFLDKEGLLRVGGRLDNAKISFDQKHPILLPSHNFLVSLMLNHEHKRLGHAGAQTVLSNFRLKYWPLDGLRETKRIIRNCVTCFRFRAQPAEQIMASLPKERVSISRCFSQVGIDYGGPFLIKSSKLRKAPLIKCYIAIFVCMVTKAIHIELVTGLSTEHFIMTLKRFIARRGNPTVIHSDNATNFQGAKNQLKELYDFFQNKTNSDSIKDFLSQNETEFKFIPPRSPHFGGIWEAAIKSAKYHILRLVGETRFTFEEFYTMLVQIEAILNSRPLCSLSNDPNDFQTLTPGHFLIGSSLTAHPEKDLTTLAENRLSIWQKLSRIQQVFWKRWSVDYLNRLQTRTKWFYNSPDVTPNTLVLLKDDDTPPLKWPLARVIEVFPGKDNKTRVVKLKTQCGVFTRSIAKVCPLPSQD